MRRTSELFSVRGEEPDLDTLAERLYLLRAHLVDSEARFPAELRAAAQAHGTGARNLIHYLALRGHDLRDLQRGLSELGLSSLGRCEAHVLHSIEQLSCRAWAPGAR
jgi:pyruvate kinase